MQDASADFATAVAKGAVTWVEPQVLADWENDGYGAGIDDLSGVAGSIDVGYDLDDGMPADVSFGDSQGPMLFEIGLAAPDGGPPSRYFSPYRTDSPLYGLDRDVAPMTVDVGLITAAGPETVRIATGQMVGLPVKGGNASVQMMSQTRLKLRASIQIRPFSADQGYSTSYPVGLYTTWLVSFLAAACGVYASPPPRAGLVLWAPMHGSGIFFYPHTQLDLGRTSQTDTFEAAYAFALTDVGFPAPELPTFVPGPYVSGMRGAIGTETKGWSIPLAEKQVLGNGTLTFFSQSESRGRWEFWIRGDSTADFASVPGGSASLNALFNNSFVHGHIVAYPGTASILMGIRTSDRKLYITIDDGSAHTLTVTSTSALPSDGEWHFCGFAWSISGNKAWINLDGTVNTGTGALVTTGLPTSADDGDSNQLGIAGFLSVSEMQMYAGANANPDTTAWGRDVEFTPGAIIYPSDLALVGAFPTAPREAYEWIASLGQAEQAAMRIDESDRLLYLPRAYFTLADQQTIAEAIDTNNNIDTLDVITDYTKIRNVINLSYTQTTPDSRTDSIFELTQIVTVLPGVSLLRVAFDTPVRYLDLVGSVLSPTTPAVVEAAAPLLYPYLTAYSTTDTVGGSYATGTQVTGRVVTWDAGGAVIELTNGTNQTWYLNSETDSNSQVPYLRLVGQVARQTVLAVSADHPASAAQRGSRSMQVDLLEIQSAQQALRFAYAILGDVAYPVDVIDNVQMFADPRRQPGDLVTVTDPKITGLTGSWRAMRVEHKINGADYQQNARLRRAVPVGVWDSTTWDNCTWGEEAL